MNIQEFTKQHIDKRTVDFNKHFRDVLAWNNVASASDTFDISDARYTKQTELVMEEYRELRKALKEDNIVEIYDGLADLFVVLSFLYALDSNRNECVVDYNDFVVTVDRYTEIVDIFDMDPDAVQQYLLSSTGDEIAVALDKLLKQLAVISYSTLVLNDVMRSNWSKFPLVDEVDFSAEKARIEAAGRYSDIRAEKIEYKGELRYVMRDGLGKVMKPSTMSQPKIAQILGIEIEQIESN